MRRAPLLLSLAFLLATGPATAQPPTYSEPFQVRAAAGDIPTTAATEPTGAWNVEQRYTASGNATGSVTFQLPHGSSLVNASCTCGAQPTINGRDVTFASPGGSTMTVLSSQPLSRAFGFEAKRPTGPGGTVVVLYVPVSYEVEAPVDGDSPGLSTDGSARIVEYRGASLPDPFWASLHVATAADDDGSDPAADGGAGVNPWLMLAVGTVLGAVVWAFLVSRGAVQAKGRKQVAATAAHVEAAANESLPVLEGRKRALLAALKEIEVAKMNNEMPTDVYDAVKADLKKQAVTVMRALETATAASEAKA